MQANCLYAYRPHYTLRIQTGPGYEASITVPATASAVFAAINRPVRLLSGVRHAYQRTNIKKNRAVKAKKKALAPIIGTSVVLTSSITASILIEMPLSVVKIVAIASGFAAFRNGKDCSAVRVSTGWVLEHCDRSTDTTPQVGRHHKVLGF